MELQQSSTLTHETRLHVYRS